MPRAKIVDQELHRTTGLSIRKARKGRGWTQEQLAEALGVATETVARWEYGTRTVSLSVLFKISDTIGVTVETLLGLSLEGSRSTESTEEVEMLDGWRVLDDESRKIVLELIRKLSR